MSMIFFVASVICFFVCLALAPLWIKDKYGDFWVFLLGVFALIFLGIAAELFRKIIENN